jgi:L-seryl-tRNA(Ser) seleniumtransferase
VIELAGGQLVDFGPVTGKAPSGGPGRKTKRELGSLLTARTAAIVYVPKPHLAGDVLPLPVVVEAARQHGVPVIVDAAAQLPPRENLWRFSQQGADLVLFSGGKGLRGPASSGLVLGRTDAVRRVAANAAPLHRPGRPMKAGKEDVIGLLAAVEWYLAQDEAEQIRRYESAVDHFVRWGRNRGDVIVDRVPYGEAGQPTPRAHIRLTTASAAERDAFLTALLATPPRIDLLSDEDADQAAEDAGFYVAPETLQPCEEAVIVERLYDELSRFREGVFLVGATEPPRPDRSFRPRPDLRGSRPRPHHRPSDRDGRILDRRESLHDGAVEPEIGVRPQPIAASGPPAHPRRPRCGPTPERARVPPISRSANG